MSWSQIEHDRCPYCLGPAWRPAAEAYAPPVIACIIVWLLVIWAGAPAIAALGLVAPIAVVFTGIAGTWWYLADRNIHRSHQ